jgi:hypothetical protein
VSLLLSSFLSINRLNFQICHLCPRQFIQLNSIQVNPMRSIQSIQFNSIQIDSLT